MKLSIHSPNRCLICNKNTPDSWEHLFPESVGGFTQARLLCTKCNNKIGGSSLVSQFKRDPSIGFAIEHISKEVPELANVLRQKRKFLGRDQLGRFVKIFFNKGKFKVATRELDDGSLICDPDEATKIVGGMSKKDGTAKLGKELLKIYNDIPSNVEAQVATGVSIKKIEIEEIIQETGANLIEDRVPTSIALNFLYFWFGNQLLKKQFDGIREFIRNAESAKTFSIERLRGKSYKPLHRFVIVPRGSSLIAYVCFFEWITYKIDFGAILSRPCKGGMFIEDIRNREALYAPTFQDHLDNKYYVLGS
jgi:hypothetical protein